MLIKNQRIVNIGNSYYVNIPARYIKDGYIKLDTDLNINVEESKDGKEE